MHPGWQQLLCAKHLPYAIASALLSLGSRGSGEPTAEMRGAFRGPFSRLKHFPLCSRTHRPLQRCGSVSRDHTVEAGVWHQDTGQGVGEGFHCKSLTSENTEQLADRLCLPAWQYKRKKERKSGNGVKYHFCPSFPLQSVSVIPRSFYMSCSSRVEVFYTDITSFKN